MSRTKFIIQSAIIAAAYVGLTVIFLDKLRRSRSGLNPHDPSFFTPSAIPGLFIGCLIANIFSPNGLPDIIIGSMEPL